MTTGHPLAPLDVLDVCAVMLQRCGLTAEQLAQHMGTLVAPAPRPEPDPPPVPVTPPKARILEMAAGSRGITSTEVQVALDIGVATAHHHLEGLVATGRLHRVKLVGVRAFRFFADAHDAAEYQRDHLAVEQEPAAPAPAPVVAPAPAPDITERASVLPKAPAKPRSPAKHQEMTVVQRKEAVPVRGEAITPPGVQVQRIPTPVDTRFAVPVGSILTGGFSATKPGTNPLTGQPW